MPFSSQFDRSSTGNLLKTSRQQSLNQIRGLFAEGGTALYDAIDAAYTTLSSQPDEGRIGAIVVLTDGADTNSTLKIEALLARFAAKRESGGIRVFTIAYGKDANKDILKRIAEATQASFAAGSTDNIITVFRDISTFF